LRISDGESWLREFIKNADEFLRLDFMDSPLVTCYLLLVSQRPPAARSSELAGLMPLVDPKINCLWGAESTTKRCSSAVRSVRLWDWKIPGVGRTRRWSRSSSATAIL